MTTESEAFAAFTASILAEAPKETPTADPGSAAAAQPTQPTSDGSEAAPAGSSPAPAANDTAPPAKTDEKPKDEPKPAEKPTDWAALAAKDKERRAAKAAAKAASAQKDRELADAKAKADKFDHVMSLAKTPAQRLEALKELGLTVDDVNTSYVDSIEKDPNKPPPALTAAQEKIASLEAKIDRLLERDEKATKATAEAQQKANNERIEAEYTARAANAIKEKPNDYEALSNHPTGSAVVFHYIAAHYAKTSEFDSEGNLIAPGEELEVHEACRRVEAALVEENKWTAGVSKLRGATKAPDSTTLAGDVRQPEPPKDQADEDTEFKKLTLRLVKQQAG